MNRQEIEDKISGLEANIKMRNANIKRMTGNNDEEIPLLESFKSQLEALEAEKSLYYKGQVGWFSDSHSDRYIHYGLLCEVRGSKFFGENGIIYSTFTPDPDADNWIGWSGGECPVGNFCGGTVLFRNGKIGSIGDLEEYRWNHQENHYCDIIAYRITKAPEVLTGK